MLSATEWLVTASAMLLALALTPLVRSWHLHHALLDVPGARRSHQVPTPRGGGVAVVVAIWLALLVLPPPWAQWWQPMLFMTALAALGWCDDHFDLSPALRLAIQAALAALALWLVGGVVTLELLGREIAAPWLWSALAGLAIVWLVNLHNFMDGSDGLASMQAVFSLLLLSLFLGEAGQVEAAWFGLAATGAYLGFLFWNRPPARIFMGDVGSLALGGAVAWLALVGASSGDLSIFMAFMLASVFTVDATATLVARVCRGQRWYTAHREHAYQRLIIRGWSHARVLLLYALVNVFLVMPVVLTARVVPQYESLLAAALALVLLLGWGVIQSATRTEKPGA